jgi:hypothetical protein
MKIDILSSLMFSLSTSMEAAGAEGMLSETSMEETLLRRPSMEIHLVEGMLANSVAN